MNQEQTRISIFQRPAWVVVLALTAAIAWGWAFPLIKVGFNAFGITADMTGSKMLFAGIRFAMAGLIVLSVARSSGRSFKAARAGDWRFILSFALIKMQSCQVKISHFRAIPPFLHIL